MENLKNAESILMGSWLLVLIGKGWKLLWSTLNQIFNQISIEVKRKLPWGAQEQNLIDLESFPIANKSKLLQSSKADSEPFVIQLKLLRTALGCIGAVSF